MTDAFQIDTLPLGAGTLGLCPLPGRSGTYDADLEQIAAFAPSFVMTLTLSDEMAAHGVDDLPERLATLGIAWAHFPIGDFGTPRPEASDTWQEIAARVHAILAHGGRVLIHCKAGRGRTGTAALRLMIEAGESPDAALARLRATRPGTVETEAQQRWAEAAGTGPATP